VNFPLWQLTRMGIPTLLAGNVLLVKHSPNTQQSSLELERVMLEAGFPEGVFQNLILKTEDIVDVINDDASRAHLLPEARVPAPRSRPKPEQSSRRP
jgi:acyl-CoA reductase-like NAD-dependent aldehyde dehydrogenase